MTSNLHPLFDCIVELHFPKPKVQPCDQCGVAPCDYYPCENIQNPMVPDPGYGDPKSLRLDCVGER